MDRIGAARLRGADVFLRREIRGDRDGLIGRARMQRAGIVGRDDGDRCDSQSLCRAEDAQRNLAAVRYEERLNRHNPARVRSATPASVRYGTASEVACATAPPTAAPMLCPGAQARLTSAKA